MPDWDGELVSALNDAILGVWNEAGTWDHEVLNDAGDPYRLLIVDGPAQHSRILECLRERGFEVSTMLGRLHIRRIVEAGASEGQRPS